MDPCHIFAGLGANVVRLRLWHTHTWARYSTLEDVKKSIHRARAAGKAAEKASNAPRRHGMKFFISIIPVSGTSLIDGDSYEYHETFDNLLPKR
jgi:hypothetical protein